MLTREDSCSFTASLLFMVVTIIIAQTGSAYMIWVWGIGLIVSGILLRKRSQAIFNTTIMATALLLGYVLYEAFSAWIRHGLADTGDLAIVLSRLGLMVFILPLAAASCSLGQGRPRLMTAGQWGRALYFPWIITGFRRDPVWRFMLIFAAVSAAAFAFVVDWSRDDLAQLAFYALLFALINAVLEELLWRGYVLSQLTEDYGDIKGLVIGGTAFGFYHLHLGFPWTICLLFSLFGMMMGAVAIRSQGLGPVIVMHAVMNLWFVMSGMII
ncbi:CPBP family intramembrane glutamic endopeptidase [Paenibacillus cisolokensis]|uniref:CPBP family intramembrane glutamic endopeptidase n=1 Tax=Paenibacillus cisolokensis TaxID=1658519 RepID=UPI003D270408